MIPNRAFRCPRCGSQRVRRSMPRDGWERFVRTVTPLHYYFCRDCDRRGVHFEAIPASGVGRGPTMGRTLEDRDRKAALVKARKTVLSVLFAGALGAAAGMYIHSCRQSEEASRPALE